MPYERNADLPESVRNALPADAQDVFREVVNRYLEQGATESRAFAAAWAAVRRAGWEKGEDGKWHKVQKAEHTGVWIGFWLPPDVAQDLAIAGGEPAENLHLTLAYVGDADVLGEELIRTALFATARYAAASRPLAGLISGIGRFNASETSNGLDVVYYSFDSPDLPEFRQGLVAALESVGVPVGRAHGFTPHITAAYVNPEADTPIRRAPPLSITFRTLQVRVGEVRRSYQLGSDLLPPKDLATAPPFSQGPQIQKAGRARPAQQPRPFRIFKADDERRLVFGWASVSIRKTGELVLDYHDDMIAPEDLEDAAYQFVLEFRATGEMHRGVAKGQLVESFVVTPEKLVAMGLPPDSLPIGWWVGFYIEDPETFAKVKAGEYRMFSIQGRAVREEVA